jgi:hypothetical protein
MEDTDSMAIIATKDGGLVGKLVLLEFGNPIPNFGSIATQILSQLDVRDTFCSTRASAPVNPRDRYTQYLRLLKP